MALSSILDCTRHHQTMTQHSRYLKIAISDILTQWIGLNCSKNVIFWLISDEFSSELFNGYLTGKILQTHRFLSEGRRKEGCEVIN